MKRGSCEREIENVLTHEQLSYHDGGDTGLIGCTHDDGFMSMPIYPLT